MSEPGIDVVTVLSRESNNWIVCLPGRRYPALVIQGDSLKSLYDIANQILEQLKGEEGELHDLAQELRDLLKGRLDTYERTLRDRGLELPYSRPVT